MAAPRYSLGSTTVLVNKFYLRGRIPYSDSQIFRIQAEAISSSLSFQKTGKRFQSKGSLESEGEKVTLLTTKYILMTS